MSETQTLEAGCEWRIADFGGKSVIATQARPDTLGALYPQCNDDLCIGEANCCTSKFRRRRRHRSPQASAPMQLLCEARLVATVGIEGDRYATRLGTYSQKHHIDRQLTLIEVETLEALARDHHIDLAPQEHRRNLTTRDVPLNHLVGQYFRVGDCVLYGGRLNTPCIYLENLVGKKVFKPLLNRSGLNCRIVVGGIVRIGDRIDWCDPGSLEVSVRLANEATPIGGQPEA